MSEFKKDRYFKEFSRFGKQFKDINDLNKHVRSVHESEKSFKRIICDQKYSEDDLRKHKDTVHKDLNCYIRKLLLLVRHI